MNTDSDHRSSPKSTACPGTAEGSEIFKGADLYLLNSVASVMTVSMLGLVGSCESLTTEHEALLPELFTASWHCL